MNTRIVLGSCASTLLLMLAGCGGSTNEGTPDATTDSPAQETSVPDVSDGGPADTGVQDVQDSATSDVVDAGSFMSDGAIYCPTQPCPGAQVCCAIPPAFIDGGPDDAGEGGIIVEDGGAGGLQCMDQCPDGGGQVACESPSGCGGATPQCCASIDLVGTGFNCSPASVTASCVAQCNEHITLQPLCPEMDTVTLCNSSADCSSMYPACCEVPMFAAFPFCAPSLVKMVPGAICH